MVDLRILLLLTLASVCRAGLLLSRAMADPNDSSSCLVNHLNRSVTVGTAWHEPHCTQATCILFRNAPYIQLSTCGRVAVAPGCSIFRDIYEEYPKCCPWAYCPDASMDDLLGPEYEEFKEWVDTYYGEPFEDYN